ncbi:sperm microtubule associated protein 2 isoform X3 [Oryctolagus cuniculus]|uniref:sperm microtubule associated protein 2 isoform X3 n=1 Tax=Oryctolagus cuniculus TaxID=9986 RepID=UPI0038792051
MEDRRFSEAGGGPGGGQDEALGLRGPVYSSLRFKDPKYRDPEDADLGLEDQEDEEVPAEEVAGDEPPGPANQEDALSESEGAPDKDAEDIAEMSRLSITRTLPRCSMARGRRQRRRLLELAEPKTNWQVLRDRMRGRCRGYAWITPCKTTLHFCLYWPSVYWTERFLEDTTLTITVPEVSPRVEELARPKRFYLEYYNNNRTTPIWPIPRSTLECQASSRLKELAAPKIRSNIWSIHMSECPRPSRTSVCLTATLAGRCWTSPRRRWPAPGLSPWHSPKCASASTRATTPTASPPPRWPHRRPLASMSWPPPRASPRKSDQPAPSQ